MVRPDEQPVTCRAAQFALNARHHKGDGAVNGRRNFYQGTRASLADRCRDHQCRTPPAAARNQDTRGHRVFDDNGV